MEAVLGLAHGPQRQIALHQIADIFFFADGPLGDPALAVLAHALFGVEIQISVAVALLADAPLGQGVGGGEIGLHHLGGDGVVFLRQRLHLRHGDQVLALVRIRHLLAQDAVNGGDGAVDLVLKVHGVVDDLQRGVRAPGADGIVVDLAGALHGLIAGGVAVVVGKLRSLGAGDQVQYRVVARQHLFLGPAEVGQHAAEFLVGYVCLVVEQRAVIDDQHLFLRHGLGGAQGQPFLVQLILDHIVLEVQHAHTAREGADAKAGDQLGGSLGDGDDLPAVFLFEFLEDPADQRGFSGGGTACQNDACDLFRHISTLLSIISLFYSFSLSFPCSHGKSRISAVKPPFSKTSTRAKLSVLPFPAVPGLTARTPPISAFSGMCVWPKSTSLHSRSWAA